MLRSRKTLRIETLERRELMAVVSGDFNGDGFQDVAVGRRGHDLAGDIESSGAVSVQYGTADGLQSTTQAFDQDSPGVPGVAEAGDQFGAALAVGDFNADGYDDLAVGVPGEDTTGTDNGAVHVFYGTFFGLETRFGSRLLTGPAGSGFGAALAAGKFNVDGYDDLAVGLPDADRGTDTPLLPGWADGRHEEAGRVFVYHGSRDGIGLVYDETFSQNENVVGDSEDGDHFGAALAAGDFNGDGFDDLAVGTPGEDYSTFGLWENKDDAGAVYIINGSRDGLIESGNYSLVDSSVLSDWAEFGGQLAAGDFNGDGISDLVVGTLGNIHAGFGTPYRPGAVDVYYGSTGKLGEADSHHWDDVTVHFTTDSPLAVGDVNGDRIDDLVFSSFDKLYEIHGGSDGLRLVRVLTDSTPGLVAGIRTYQITAGDYDGDGLADLAAVTPSPVSSVLSFVQVGSIANPPGVGSRYGRLQVIEGASVLGLQVAGNYLVNLYGPGTGSGIVGLANTNTTGSNNSASGMTIVQEDTFGTEWLTDAATVEKLFQQILGRAPGAAGLQYHVDRLAQGAPLSSVAAGIFESPERLDPIVRQMYRDFLLRDAGPSEVAYYRDQWQREGSPDNIRANIISSPEFYQSAGGSDGGWVGELYQRLLGRTADSTEVQYWTDRLAQGAGRKQVVFGFLRSDESFRNLAMLWYGQYLNRRPSEEEMTFVVAAMRGGTTQRDIQMQLIDLEEYRRVPA